MHADEHDDRAGIEVEEREAGAPPTLEDLEGANATPLSDEEISRAPGDPAGQPRP